MLEVERKRKKIIVKTYECVYISPRNNLCAGAGAGISRSRSFHSDNYTREEFVSPKIWFTKLASPKERKKRRD